MVAPFVRRTIEICHCTPGCLGSGPYPNDSRFAANFARVNQIYQQSGVDVEFDVAHHEQVDFSAVDPANWKATLSLALMNSELGLAAYAPYLETIEAIRDLHAGDIVIYWRDFQDGGPVSNGAGSVGGGEDEAYVQLTYGGVNPPVTAHETGHLLGGQHSSGVQGTATFAIDTSAPMRFRLSLQLDRNASPEAVSFLKRFYRDQ